METAELSNTCQAKEICRTFDADCFLGHKLSCWNNNLLLGNTINGHNYVDLLAKLTEVVTIKREITRTHNLHLLQVNAASHSERSVQATANDLNIVILIHSPCSPDFVASDILYSQIFKEKIKGNHSDSAEEIIRACDEWFCLKNRVFYFQSQADMAEVC